MLQPSAGLFLNGDGLSSFSRIAFSLLVGLLVH